MKSFKSVINVLPLSAVSPPFPFIDDTKVQQVAPMVKDMILHLLKKNIRDFYLILLDLEHKGHFLDLFVE